MSVKFRLILDSPRTAALNLAIDEFLMGEVSLPDTPPVLRIYSWQAPSYSIGYFQKTQALARKMKTAGRKIPIVRRLTGGGLVFHGEDLTFSLVIRYPNPFFPSDTRTSYLKINDAVRAGLRRLCPELDFADCKTIPRLSNGRERVCFESPACYDLMLNGRKVVGASQRRSRGVLLHESSVFLPGGHALLAGKILEGFREKWNINFEELALSERELEEAGRIEGGRYASPDWAIF